MQKLCVNRPKNCKSGSEHASFTRCRMVVFRPLPKSFATTTCMRLKAKSTAPKDAPCRRLWRTIWWTTRKTQLCANCASANYTITGGTESRSSSIPNSSNRPIRSYQWTTWNLPAVAIWAFSLLTTSRGDIHQPSVRWWESHPSQPTCPALALGWRNTFKTPGSTASTSLNDDFRYLV